MVGLVCSESSEIWRIKVCKLSIVAGELYADMSNRLWPVLRIIRKSGTIESIYRMVIDEAHLLPALTEIPAPLTATTPDFPCRRDLSMPILPRSSVLNGDRASM